MIFSTLNVYQKKGINIYFFLFCSAFAALSRINFFEDFGFMLLPKRKILSCRIKRMIAIEHRFINAIGVGSLVTVYISYLLCQHRVWDQIYLWMSLARNQYPFLVVPWTCLLLIRASRYIDSGSTVSRAERISSA